MKYGIAFFSNGEHPLTPGAILVGWRQANGQDEVWDDKDTALYENDMGGWTGYVCEYPSGKFNYVGPGGK